MKKSAKVWLYIALIICSATTIMNATYGRWPSVVLAVISIIGLAVLLFMQKKAGFILMCVCYALSFLVSVSTGGGETSLAVTILMSFIGSAIIPVLPALFLRGQWNRLH